MNVVLTEHFKKILEEATPKLSYVHRIKLRDFLAALTLASAMRLAEEVQRREAWTRQQRQWRSRQRRTP